ncbi:Protein of unknown function [Gryllus bimaculatus]|nr:Protein of unknown function [Gryllus bimaculatus]
MSDSELEQKGPGETEVHSMYGCAAAALHPFHLSGNSSQSGAGGGLTPECRFRFACVVPTLP